jgi:hypothetical protein
MLRYLYIVRQLDMKKLLQILMGKIYPEYFEEQEGSPEKFDE